MTADVVLVAGPAGSGKSSVATAVAQELHAVLLDLDTLTNPVLEAVQDRLGPGGSARVHWNDESLSAVVRPARYRALLDVAAVQRRLGHRVVLAAPFTAELAGGGAWDHLVRTLGAEPMVLWLDVSTHERARRLAARGESRDAGRSAVSAAEPVVPHLRVDGSVSRDAVRAHALSRLH